MCGEKDWKGTRKGQVARSHKDDKTVEKNKGSRKTGHGQQVHWEPQISKMKQQVCPDELAKSNSGESASKL